jgi:hypothetical protein
MSNHSNHDHAQAAAPRPSKRARLQALLFTAASIGTTLLTLGLLSDVKMPRVQGE